MEIPEIARTPQEGTHVEWETQREWVMNMDVPREAEYIIDRAHAHVTCIVTHCPLVYFSTATGDAWMLDPEDKFALCLARDGDRQDFHIVEKGDTYAIEWNSDYDIKGNTFVVMERAGRIRSILGYPIKEIEKAIRNTH